MKACPYDDTACNHARSGIPEAAGAQRAGLCPPCFMENIRDRMSPVPAPGATYIMVAPSGTGNPPITDALREKLTDPQRLFKRLD